MGGRGTAGEWVVIGDLFVFNARAYPETVTACASTVRESPGGAAHGKLGPLSIVLNRRTGLVFLDSGYSADRPVRSALFGNAVSSGRTSRVSSCVTAAGQPSACTTTRPLPRNARRLKTSTCQYSRSSMTIWLILRGRAQRGSSR